VADRLRTAWTAMPLRRRLVIGVLTVMATALVVVGLATFLALRSWMTDQIDTSLTQGKARFFTEADDRSHPEEALQTWTTSGASLVVLSPDGQATGETFAGDTTPRHYSAADARTLATMSTSASAGPVTIELEALGSSRAVAVPAIDGRTATPVTLVAFIPLSRTSKVAGRLVIVELVTISLALLMMALIATWFVRRSLRPLQEVADTASEVASLPLERGDVAIPARVPNPIPTTEVGQVGLAVNAMLDHIESSLQTRADSEDKLRRFVSDAGHELRTPLAAVRGYAELMRRGAGSDPEQSLVAAQRIEAAANRMGLLVEDLLLLASMDEERPLSRDAIDLLALVEDTVAEAATAGPEHEWAAEGPERVITVVGDAVRLHQAVANLLANARAHTPEGTSVITTVGISDSLAYVEVRDNGPGFPDDLLPRATERFARGDASRSRATGGSGLGLAIVKAVAEAHGGSLEVGNDYGGTGAVIRLSLPLQD